MGGGEGEREPRLDGQTPHFERVSNPGAFAVGGGEEGENTHAPRVGEEHEAMGKCSSGETPDTKVSSGHNSVKWIFLLLVKDGVLLYVSEIC